MEIYPNPVAVKRSCRAKIGLQRILLPLDHTPSCIALYLLHPSMVLCCVVLCSCFGLDKFTAGLFYPLASLLRYLYPLASLLQHLCPIAPSYSTSILHILRWCYVLFFFFVLVFDPDRHIRRSTLSPSCIALTSIFLHRSYLPGSIYHSIALRSTYCLDPGHVHSLLSSCIPLDLLRPSTPLNFVLLCSLLVFGPDQEGYLCWCGTLPPYYKTRVAAETLLKATRAGNLVVVQIANQGDVGFQCSRLTDAIVLEVGLNGVIRACGKE